MKGYIKLMADETEQGTQLAVSTEMQDVGTMDKLNIVKSVMKTLNYNHLDILLLMLDMRVNDFDVTYENPAQGVQLTSYADEEELMKAFEERKVGQA